ncbi:MAG: 50S ribosomal protein L11 methyltransferase [Lentisphaeria bacterium]|nr:50S ribosomal protein L11 methyltransferase [Lentisphaeria bacterium]
MNELLFCIPLEDPSGEFENAAELLNALELEFSSYFDRENCSVKHTVYTLDAESAAGVRERLTEVLPMWRKIGVDLKMGEIFELHKSEWAEAWKKYFKPVEISEKLLVRPSWLNDPPRPGQKVLEINPGMSFGTGQHATTLFCLKQIDKLAAAGKSLLDAGCGSGILAIAGALLGYGVIDAFDFDPEAVEVAKENIALNNCSDAITPETGNAADWQGRPEKYDVVCANILGHLLISFRFNIVSWVAPGGSLVLAGILERDFDKVSASYAELGMVEVERFTDREWTGGVFRFANTK